MLTGVTFMFTPQAIAAAKPKATTISSVKAGLADLLLTGKRFLKQWVIRFTTVQKAISAMLQQFTAAEKIQQAKQLQASKRNKVFCKSKNLQKC